MRKYNKISVILLFFTVLFCISTFGAVSAADTENTGPTVAANLTGGTYNTTQTVALSSNDSSATIYYANDTTDPRTSSTRTTYTGSPITISKTTTLRYAAVDINGNWGPLYLQNYVIGTGTSVNNTGQSNYTGPQTNTTDWKYNLKTEVFGSPAIGSDGTIYIGTYNGIDKDGNFYALNPDGTLKWKYHTYGIMGTPAIGADGTIYVGSYLGVLYAFNPNGTVKWAFDIYFSDTGNIKNESTLWDRTIDSSPTIGADGTIYIATANGGSLYAVNPNGTLKWKYRISNVMYSAPAIGSDGTIYIGSWGDFTFYAINPDGTLKWEYKANSQIYGSPAIGADGTIYVGISGTFGNNQGQLTAFNPDGSIKWTYLADGEIWNNIKIGSDGTIYFGTRDGKAGNGTYGIDRSFYAINPNGTLKWKYQIGEYIRGYVIGADGTIYVGSGSYYENGDLYAFNPNGTVKWNYTAGGSPAISADGALYFGSFDGNLYAIKDPIQDTTKPVITAKPSGGLYNSPQNVTLETIDANTTKTYYTTDGTDPTTSTTRKEYTGAIPINTTTILKFAAVDSADNWSLVYIEPYFIYKSVPYKYTVKVAYKKGWYKYWYKVSYKKWYKYKGKWKYKWATKSKYKWKYGWLYKTVIKTGTKNVLT